MRVQSVLCCLLAVVCFGARHAHGALTLQAL